MTWLVNIIPLQSICETAFIFHYTLSLRRLQTAISTLERKRFRKMCIKVNVKLFCVLSINQYTMKAHGGVQFMYSLKKENITHILYEF
jgi:hypothetical protein